MKSQEKILQLQKIINDQLTPLITHDYWLLEVPYYPNVGDGLIWQGEVDFLKSLPYQCKGMSSYDRKVPNNISTNDIILLQGGGNFGDIWPLPQNYRINVIEKYPNNKVVIFPQSVWFEHKENLLACASLFSKYQNVTICARDNYSYNILKQNFTNDIRLVPDMAFCINKTKWETTPATKEILLLKREDKELKQSEELTKLEVKTNCDITDWPTFSEDSWQKRWFRRTRKYLSMFPKLYDIYANVIFRPYLIRSGIDLISSHKKIYSTRLHAAVLCVLLGKAEDLVWFDNSYGKNKNFYDTWLKDCDGIQFLDNN